MKSNRKNEQIVDINQLVLSITAKGSRPLLSDEVWRCYGFRKTPSRKNIFAKVFPKKERLEKHIINEVLTMGLVDVMNGIRKSKESSVTKTLICLGVIDQFMSMTKHIIEPEELIESLITTYESYLGMGKTDLHAPIVFRAKEKLNKKDFSRFKEGINKLLALKQNGDFLVKSKWISELIENSYKDKKLNISMSDKEYERYSALIKERILGI